MNLEQQLQEHFNRSGAQLTEPQERLDEVVTRGRRRRVAQGGMALAAVAALAVAAPVVLSQLDRSRVEFGAPATAPPEAPTTQYDIETEQTGKGTGDPDIIAVADLGAPVLGFQDSELDVYNADQPYGFEGTPEKIDNALPDGAGGFVVKQGKDVNWHPSLDVRDGVFAVDVGDSEGDLILRMVLRGRNAAMWFGSPEPRLLYSVVTPNEDPEQSVERFYAVTLARGERPELVESASAHESWIEGPTIAADGEFVHGACHLMCSLYRGLAADRGDALYHGGGDKAGTNASISGLTASPDGKVVAFVESHPAYPPSPKHPQVLVLLDGSSFKTLARIELPAGPNPKKEWGPTPVVSISADGQRVLISGHSANKEVLTQGRTFLIDSALTSEPRTHYILHFGPLRWMDPAAANQ